MRTCRKSRWLFAALAVALASCQPVAENDRPSLIVLVGIDQFRADYLERYGQVFSGGFKRLLDEGRWYPRAIVDHAPTLSYPGHTTLATGAHPRTHGITSNAWLETLPSGERRRVFVAIDPQQRILGDPDATGLSPKNLRVTGLADWVRAADPEARAVALSTGPALAMVYGGVALDDETRNHAYWLSSSRGRFVTSSYFRSEFPDWVSEFNEIVMPGFDAYRVWESTVPQEYRGLARADSASYEGDGTHTAFPHSFADVGAGGEGYSGGYDPEEAGDREYYRWFFNTPFADEALFELARTAVERLALGQRGGTDYLAIAVKSVDRIGHDYGPLSQEQLDILLRLDRLLGSLLEQLDEYVGQGRYVVAVSADHGAPNITEYEIEEGRPGRRVSEQEIQELLDRVERLVQTYSGPEDELPERIAVELENADFVARAMTPAELGGEGPADEILRAHRHSYIAGRNTPFPLWTREIIAGRVSETHPANWGIVVEFTENAQLWTAATTHMSAYDYDRVVPILLMGRGVERGVDSSAARTIDIAPTLAALAGLAYPATVDGTVMSVR